MPQSDPRPGEKYLHFKNKLYQVITIAQHAETGEKMVVYQALYGTFQTYVRPWSMFVSLVDRQKYPQAEQKYRFQWVEFKEEGQEPAREDGPVEGSAKQNLAGQGLPKLEMPGQEPSGLAAPQKEMSVEEKMMAFFDADTSEEKYNILATMRGEVTDRMINNMAVVLDVVIEEGPLDIRYEELKACLRTMQRYECSRLR